LPSRKPLVDDAEVPLHAPLQEGTPGSPAAWRRYDVWDILADKTFIAKGP
jgi:hypothetical protein